MDKCLLAPLFQIFLSEPHCSWDKKKTFNTVDTVQHYLASTHPHGYFWDYISFNIQPPHRELASSASRSGCPNFPLYLYLGKSSKVIPPISTHLPSPYWHPLILQSPTSGWLQKPLERFWVGKSPLILSLWSVARL